MGNTLTFDIGGTVIKYALFNDSGEPLVVSEIPTNAILGGEFVIKKIMEIADGFAGFSNIGISTCGQVDNATGEIIYATDNIPNYTGAKLKQILEQHCQVPVAVENDVNAAALGEAFSGSAQNFSTFLCLTFGTGIGGAIIIDQTVFSGANGSAGEFGHFITHAGGKPCTCGFNGCYEAYASTTALVRAVQEQTGQFLNGKQIFESFHQGNQAICSIVNHWLDEITIGLVGLVHIFNPHSIVLGGGIMAESYIVQQLQQRILCKVMPSYRSVKLIQAALGNKAGLYGAYYIANFHGNIKHTAKENNN
jgi:glucokinase